MHYLPFMAAITLPPLVGRGDEGRSVEVVGGIEGETQPAEGWRWELQHISKGGGGCWNPEGLSVELYCSFSVIAAQIRASRCNHLHTDQCSVLGDDRPDVTADIFI